MADQCLGAQPDPFEAELLTLRAEMNSLKEFVNRSGNIFPGYQSSTAGNINIDEAQKTVFMPQGNDGHDRLVLELVDHDNPVEQFTIFCRPTIQSHPVELLRKLGASDNKLRRTQICLDAYKSGRMKYTEVLSKRKLWALLRYCPEQKFCSYHCDDISLDDVKRHLDHLLELVDSINGYRLVLSEVSVPIFFATFEVERKEGSDYWTVMTADQAQAQEFKPSSFVIRDPMFHRGLKSSIFEMVWKDSSTIADPRDVVAELLKVRQYLVEHGPFETPMSGNTGVGGPNNFLT